MMVVFGLVWGQGAVYLSEFGVVCVVSVVLVLGF